jgi:hypothetical protein
MIKGAPTLGVIIKSPVWIVVLTEELLFAIIICSFWLPVAALREVCKNNYSVVASTGRNDRIKSPEPRQDAGFNFFC